MSRARVNALGVLILVLAIAFALRVVERRTEERVRAERLPVVCPYYLDGEPLVNTTRYPDGSATCRYANQSRGILREVRHAKRRAG